MNELVVTHEELGPLEAWALVAVGVSFIGEYINDQKFVSRCHTGAENCQCHQCKIRYPKMARAMGQKWEVPDEDQIVTQVEIGRHAPVL